MAALCLLAGWTSGSPEVVPPRRSAGFVVPAEVPIPVPQAVVTERLPRRPAAHFRSIVTLHPERRERAVEQQSDLATSAAESARPEASGGSVVGIIEDAFCQAGQCSQVTTAISKAQCESGLDPSAMNPSGAAGLFQLMPFWWDGSSSYGWVFDPYDAYQNAYHAALIVATDPSWSNWVC